MALFVTLDAMHLRKSRLLARRDNARPRAHQTGQGKHQSRTYCKAACRGVSVLTTRAPSAPFSSQFTQIHIAAPLIGVECPCPAAYSLAVKGFSRRYQDDKIAIYGVILLTSTRCRAYCGAQFISRGRRHSLSNAKAAEVTAAAQSAELQWLIASRREQSTSNAGQTPPKVVGEVARLAARA